MSFSPVTKMVENILLSVNLLCVHMLFYPLKKKKAKKKKKKEEEKQQNKQTNKKTNCVDWKVVGSCLV